MLPSPLSSAFSQALLAYGASEAAAKATRLLVVIVVARSLGAAEIGVAAAAMAAGDILKALSENGVGQRIIAASEATLASTCRTAHRIFWLWCLGLFALQAALSAVIWGVSGDGVLALLVLILAAEYLFMPAGLVQAALAMRAGKMKQTAAIAGAQVSGANLATVALVLMWPSALALVLPRLLSAPIWLIAMRRLHPWSPDNAVRPAALGPFWRFGRAVLAIEIVKALRLHADKLLIGALMGAEALGVYFVAFNAGLGLANAITQAFSVVVFPHLATASDRDAALRQAVSVGLTWITPLILLQALLAPVYVPILLGDGWSHIVPIVSVLCLAAIPAVLWSSAAAHLRAEGKPGAELRASLVIAGALILNTIITAPFGLFALACGTLVVASVSQVALAAPILRPLLAPRFQGA